jgi:ABC-2 type transport system ATP-binding protein
MTKGDERGGPLALRAEGAGRRYGRRWALRECTFGIPRGRVAALVGPNGAGKSTLLHLAAGLARADAGRVLVFGGSPCEDRATLARVGFVAQDKPLYRGFPVADLVRFGAAMNPRWDGAGVAARLRDLGISARQRAGTLSGGQQTQVALALALGKRPNLLLLDEPTANLDPLARREFLAAVRADAAVRGLTVVFSSHVVGELGQICDYLVLISASRVVLSGDVAGLLARHHAASLEGLVLSGMRGLPLSEARP